MRQEDKDFLNSVADKRIQFHYAEHLKEIQPDRAEFTALEENLAQSLFVWDRGIAALALSHSCGEGCLHPVSLPIAYTADYVKAACSKASADALTWADGYATHPTEIVIDPKTFGLR